MSIKAVRHLLCACLLFSFAHISNAALISRLGGLAYYDTDANLTWLADANYAQTSGYDVDGLLSWSESNTWVAGLNINGVTGWRLPDTVQPDLSCSSQAVASWGYNCTGSEMGNLFHNVLGGITNISIATTHNANYDLFSNVQTGHIQSGYYWSATEYQLNTDNAFIFSFSETYQGTFAKTEGFFAWAVQTGDVGASIVPIPAAVWLFASGLIGLVGFARRNKILNLT
ncbi:MAG: VPLPA-CTERM sorting domain-containing protein [Gammaproteobacteria bacterium]|nr:VPLPA-CTERM sorting domain-containing protein [Gammaproteobacteria bacterium]MDH5594610.1 VPLPA-CTERM sorting domain-containing protein [Gammaproteobacteria bacterium]